MVPDSSLSPIVCSTIDNSPATLGTHWVSANTGCTTSIETAVNSFIIWGFNLPPTCILILAIAIIPVVTGIGFLTQLVQHQHDNVVVQKT